IRMTNILDGALNSYLEELNRLPREAKLDGGALDRRTLTRMAPYLQAFARLAREAKVETLHTHFGLTWEDFCLQQLRQPAVIVEAAIANAAALGEEIPVPLGVAERVARHAP